MNLNKDEKVYEIACGVFMWLSKWVYNYVT